MGLAAVLLAGALSATGPAATATTPETAGGVRAGRPAAQAQPPRLAFGPCDDPGLVEAGAECGTLAVPLDHRRPDGRTIDLRVSRIPARHPAARRGVLLLNPGGPGGAGIGFPARLRPALGDVARRYDLIGFDPRFAGESTPIDCGSTTRAALLRSAGEDRQGFDESVELSRRYAARCHARHADVLPYAGTRDVARDMDAIRAALGEERISYYGVSWGAELGALYSQLFPGRVDRMVLDSATPGDLPDYEAVVALGPPLEAALDEWAAWTAQRHGEFTLGRTAQEVRDVVSRILAHADEQPIPIGSHHVDDNTLPLLLRGLLDDEANDRALATAVRNLVDADAGQQVAVSGGLAAELEAIHRRAPVVDRDVASSFATRCADGGYPTVPGDHWRQIQRHRQAQPIFGPLVHNVSPCTFWEATAQELPRVVGNDVPALIVQAERDTVTPLAGARELHRKLTASRLVTADVRAHGVYIRGVDGYGSIPCVEQAVDRYLLDGTLPAGDVRCAA